MCDQQAGRKRYAVIERRVRRIRSGFERVDGFRTEIRVDDLALRFAAFLEADRVGEALSGDGFYWTRAAELIDVDLVALPVRHPQQVVLLIDCHADRLGQILKP